MIYIIKGIAMVGTAVDNGEGGQYIATNCVCDNNSTANYFVGNDNPSGKGNTASLINCISIGVSAGWIATNNNVMRRINCKSAATANGVSGNITDIAIT